MCQGSHCSCWSQDVQGDLNRFQTLLMPCHFVFANSLFGNYHVVFTMYPTMVTCTIKSNIQVFKISHKAFVATLPEGTCRKEVLILNMKCIWRISIFCSPKESVCLIREYMHPTPSWCHTELPNGEYCLLLVTTELLTQCPWLHIFGPLTVIWNIALKSGHSLAR